MQEPKLAENFDDRVALPCRLLRPSAQLPAYATAGAAGMDLCACPEDSAPIRLPPGARTLVPTGLQVAIPEGYEGQVRPRSGWALRHGVTVLNSPGTIDSDYRGEIMVLLINLGQAEVEVRPGDRVAQLVLAPVTRAIPAQVEDLGETRRGQGGYGHTGGQPEVLPHLLVEATHERPAPR